MRFVLCAAVLTALAAGCVPVTEPLSEVEKAEPDKALLGEWVASGQMAFRIDAPVVKGNPKGLMRAAGREVGEQPWWFFVSTVGKHRYANVILAGGKDLKFLQFDTEGAFGDWQKEKEKAYFVLRYTASGDSLAIDGGNREKFMAAAAKLPKAKGDFFFATPAGWLKKHLDGSGADGIYDGSNRPTYEKRPAK